jgi:hypothetical protein
MARNALQVLDDLGLLDPDTLLFISEHANENAGEHPQGDGAQRSNGFANTGSTAFEATFGLEIAAIAPDSTPVEPDVTGGAPSLSTANGWSHTNLSSGHSNTPVEAGHITLLEPMLFGAKGSPGPPEGKGGGGSGGGEVTGVYDDYFSGSDEDDKSINPGLTDGFDIWLDFKGSDWTVDLQQAFINAADYFTTIITVDIGGGGSYRGKVIDDLYVTAELKAIDGTGGILGQAGPTAVWTANELTAAGKMQFDVADANTFFDKGLWDDIVTHELMHVLGFGTLWEFGTRDLVDGTNYIGTAGVDAYEAWAGDTNINFIPVEEDGGGGTAGGHWDEGAHAGDLDDTVTVDSNELMTGYINDNSYVKDDGVLVAATNDANYLSEFSVMSLADLGYAVTYQDYIYDNPLEVA